MWKIIFTRLPFSFVIFIASLITFVISISMSLLFDISNSWVDSTVLLSSIVFYFSIFWTVYDVYVSYSVKKMQRDLSKTQ